MGGKNTSEVRPLWKDFVHLLSGEAARARRAGRRASNAERKQRSKKTEPVNRTFRAPQWGTRAERAQGVLQSSVGRLSWKMRQPQNIEEMIDWRDMMSSRIAT